MKSVTNYPFNLSAGQSINISAVGDYFRVQSATGAIDVTIDGVGTLPDLLNGQGIKNIPFNRLTIKDKSGAANAGVIMVAFDEFIDNRTYGVNDLSAGSLNTLRQPLAQTGFFTANGALGINTAETIFSAGSNINGAIILTADLMYYDGAGGAVQSLIAKATAPANIADGSVILTSKPQFASGSVAFQATLPKEQFIPAGLGLFHIANGAISGAATVSIRACRFRLL